MSMRFYGHSVVPVFVDGVRALQDEAGLFDYNGFENR